MELQDQIELGKEAERFLLYVEENPYFKGLVDRIKLTYAQQILSLNNLQKDEFADYRCRITGIEDIMNAISGDIALGQSAFDELNGNKPKGGIL